MYLRFGDKGDQVKEVQIALNVEPDGIFGRITEAAVKNFQQKNGLFPDGIVTPEVRTLLLVDDMSSDTSERVKTLGELPIERYWLQKDEYHDIITEKKFIFLHHTAGSHNPYFVIDGWERDKRGRVGTEYVIGGQDLKGNEDLDGVILQAFPEGRWANHIGNVNSFMHSRSIGIELCNWGGLTEKDGIFYNSLKRKISKNQVTTLKKPFRGFIHFHKYTDNQIQATRDLMLALGKEYEIDLTKGLKELLEKHSPEYAFDYFTDVAAGKKFGVFSHTNVNKVKHDIYPCPRLITMLKSL
jgi:N-acetyl-anhydromuramyl-L-alanine amidase AmpD